MIWAAARITGRLLCCLSFIVLFLVFTSCSDTRSSSHSFNEFLDDGVPVAASTGGPKFKDDLFNYELLLTLQQDPGNPESLLYGRTGFEWEGKGFFRDEDGYIFVLDRGNARVAVFNPSGEYERSIGRKGEGPGEWGDSFELFDVSDGVLTVYDPGPRRTTFYSSDGTLLNMVHAPVNGFIIHYLEDKEHFLVIGGGTLLGEDFISSDVGFRTVDNDGNTIASFRTQMVRERYSYPWETRTGVVWTSMPFALKPFARFFPKKGILLIAGSEPVVWWYAADGTLIRKLTVDLPAKPVTRADIDMHFQILEDQMGESASPVDIERLKRMRREVKYPANRVHWRFVSMDDYGYIWLEAMEPGLFNEEGEKGSLYHILSPAGEYLGTTRAPAAGRVMNGHFLGVVYDPETGQEDYRVWRLVPAYEDFNYPR